MDQDCVPARLSRALVRFEPWSRRCAASDTLHLRPLDRGVLLALARGGPFPALKLARLMGTNLRALYRALERLERLGFTIREPDVQDGRLVAARLTDGGLAWYQSWIAGRQQLLERTLRLLSREDRRRLMALLRLWEQRIPRLGPR